MKEAVKMTQISNLSDVSYIKFDTHDAAKRFCKIHNLTNKAIIKTAAGIYRIYPRNKKLYFSPREYIKVAKDLCYQKSVIDKLKECKREEDAEKIMIEARHNL